jgi:hypothetical protein
MRLAENHQRAAHVVHELELGSGKRWQDIADPKLHDAITSLAARPSEAQLRQAVRYIKRFRNHVVHGQPLSTNLMPLNAVDSSALRASLQCRGARQRSAAIPRQPGTFFAQMLRLFMTARAFRRYVYPAITEMQAEYYEALGAGDRRQARWVVVRGHVLVLPTFLYGLIALGIRSLLVR